MTSQFSTVAVLFLGATIAAGAPEQGDLTVRECTGGFCTHDCKEHHLKVDTCEKRDDGRSHKVTCETHHDGQSCGKIEISEVRTNKTFARVECGKSVGDHAELCDKCYERRRDDGKEVRYEKTECNAKDPKKDPVFKFDCDDKCEQCKHSFTVPRDGKCFGRNTSKYVYKWQDTFECPDFCEWRIYKDDACKHEDTVVVEYVPTDVCVAEEHHEGEKSYKFKFEKH